MSADEPAIDTEQLPIPTGAADDARLTVRDVRRARAFCAALLGGRVVIEENPCIVELVPSVDVVDGRIQTVRMVRNPDKLGHL